MCIAETAQYYRKEFGRRRAKSTAARSMKWCQAQPRAHPVTFVFRPPRFLLPSTEPHAKLKAASCTRKDSPAESFFLQLCRPQGQALRALSQSHPPI